MPILLGRQRGTIRRNAVRRNQRGTLYVSLNVELEGGMLPCNIWLTKKAARIAKDSLRQIGYDPQTNSISRLSTESTLLEGRTAPFLVEEEVYQGKKNLKCRVDLGDGEVPEPAELAKIDQLLKDAGDDKPSPPPGDQPPVGQPPPEDDIPF